VTASVLPPSPAAFAKATWDDVAPYFDELKPRTTAVFADGLDNFFRVDAFPTVIVLDRTGKIAYRSDGFGDSAFTNDLSTAVRRALGDASSAATK